jgi:hypothetical protein
LKKDFYCQDKFDDLSQKKLKILEKENELCEAFIQEKMNIFEEEKKRKKAEKDKLEEENQKRKEERTRDQC